MQLKNYAGALDNPPVMVVCNREKIEIHPCFTGYPSTPRIIPLAEIGQPENMQALDAVSARHRIDWRWVRGHAGHDGNERAEELANKGVDTLAQA